MKKDEEELPDWILDRETVSQSEYLYGCEAWEFDIPIEVQRAFIKEREDRVEKTIALIYANGMGMRDEERLRECLHTRSWVEKMYTSIGGRE